MVRTVDAAKPKPLTEVRSSTISRKLQWIVLLACFTTSWLPAVAQAAAPSGVRRPLVLTLHSYTPSDWDNKLQSGINEAFVGTAGVDLYIDYMDTRKLVTPEYLDMFRQVLAIKYRQLKFDLVITCDDAAYQYARQHHNLLWPGVPVIFCGVNDFRPQEFASLNNMTGVSENSDLRNFVSSFSKLIPSLKKLFIIRDDSSYGREMFQRLMEAISGAAPTWEFEILDNSSLTAEELTRQLERLPSNSAVFYVSFSREAGGRIVNGSEVRRILQHSAAPLFTSHEAQLGAGALGACYVDPLEHGRAAGQLARRVLEGSPVSSIPPAVGPLRKIAFDHAALKRFNIAKSALPAGSSIVNEPFSFYRQYRTLVWATLGAMTLLLVLVLLLVSNMLVRRRVTRRLTESEEKFNAFMRALPGFAFIKDGNGRVVFMNDSMQRVFSLAHSNDFTISKLLPASEANRILEDDDQVRTGLKPLVAEQTITIDRTAHTFLTSKFPIIRPGQPPLFGGVAVDISDRKRAEAALRESEEKFARAFHDSPVGMLIRDLQTGCYTEINHCCVTLFGYSREEVLDHTPEQVGWQEIATPATHALSKIPTGFADREVNIHHKDGRTITCAQTAHAFRVAGRDCLLIVLVDITSHKRSEEEREKLQAQLNQVQKMESIGRLAGGVAHDFNNMLTAIQANAMLARQAVPEKSPLAESLDEILLCTRRSAELTQRLLAFARKQTIAPRVLNLNDVVDGTLRLLRRLIGERIELKWYPAPDLGLAKLDPSQIDQILTNLCVNSRDAISEIGEVSITTQNVSFDDAYCARHAGYMSGSYVMLAVSDNGCGMDKEVLQHLFEPFFTTKPTGQGTGLGLPTVYGIVKQNQGFITVQTEVKKGTTVRIYLPRHHQSFEIAKPTPAVAPSGRGHETILIVEDEPAILRISKRTLENLGYQVMAANSPTEAIQLANRYGGTIDLLITDVVMPEMNGRDLAHQILTQHPGIKKLFMSGYTSDVIAHGGVLEEDIHFLQKPFTIHDIAGKVRAVLDAKA